MSTECWVMGLKVPEEKYGITMTAAVTLMELDGLISSAESCVEMGDNCEKKQPLPFHS